MAFARKWVNLEHPQRPLHRSSLPRFQSQTLQHRPKQPRPSQPQSLQPGDFAFSAAPRTLPRRVSVTVAERNSLSRTFNMYFIWVGSRVASTGNRKPE
jgi:hypothetical protein